MPSDAIMRRSATVISGLAELTIEGQAIRLEPGNSWLVPAGAEHSYRVLEAFTAVEATAPPPRSTGVTTAKQPNLVHLRSAAMTPDLCKAFRRNLTAPGPASHKRC